MSPFSGCLTSIIQIILIISVFWLVSKPLTYMKKVDSNKVNEYIEQIKTEEGKASANIQKYVKLFKQNQQKIQKLL